MDSGMIRNKQGFFQKFRGFIFLCYTSVVYIYFLIHMDLYIFIEKRFLVPDGCDLVAAGALPVAFGTSHVALVHRAQLKPGQVFFFLCVLIYHVYPLNIVLADSIPSDGPFLS